MCYDVKKNKDHQHGHLEKTDTTCNIKSHENYGLDQRSSSNHMQQLVLRVENPMMYRFFHALDLGCHFGAAFTVANSTLS